MRGWRLFFVPPLAGLALALVLGGLTHLGLVTSGGAGWLLGLALFVILPALAGGLYGLGPGEGRRAWVRALAGSWPSVCLTMVVLAGFGGAADLLTSLHGAAILGIASLAGALARLSLRLRAKAALL